MVRDPNDRPDPQHALESLAKEMNVKVDDVVKLYDESVSKLASRAKIDTYLHVFAMRELQEKLKTRKPS